MHQSDFECRGGVRHARIVSEPKSFFRNAEQVAVEPRIAVFIVNRRYAIISGRNMVPNDCCVTLTGRDRRGAGSKRFLCIFRPSVGRFKDDGPDDPKRIMQTVYMNAQGAAIGGIRNLVERHTMFGNQRTGERQKKRGKGREPAICIHTIL